MKSGVRYNDANPCYNRDPRLAASILYHGQRLVIARALLRTDSAVYIFDEAASNIDVESEELIMNVIHELAKTKTVLLISHRLANVVKSDKIYFLKDGEIKEIGKHDELMSQNGAYRHLYESQMALENYGKGALRNE